MWQEAAFDTRQALAYSCNYFFSKVGEALSEKPFMRCLVRLGLAFEQAPAMSGRFPERCRMARGRSAMRWAKVANLQ